MIRVRQAAFVGSLVVLGGILGGCAAPPKPPLYYYGDYQKSLYKFKKDPTAASAAKHQASLEKVISVSKEKNQRVPPGIYCEYAYLLWQKGQRAEAEANFGLETQTYPESAVFVALVLKILKHEPST